MKIADGAGRCLQFFLIVFLSGKTLNGWVVSQFKRFLTSFGMKAHNYFFRGGVGASRPHHHPTINNIPHSE